MATKVLFFKYILQDVRMKSQTIYVTIYLYGYYRRIIVDLYRL